MAAPFVARWRRTAMTMIPLRFDDLVAQNTPAGRRRVLRDIRRIAEHGGLVAAPGSW